QRNDKYPARTGHFITFWSVPTEIYLRGKINNAELAILEFGPRKDRSSWRYATNGMSEYIQTHEREIRTELFACTKDRQKWATELLDALSRYPQQECTFFAEFDTVAVGQPIDRNDSPFTAILLA